MKMRLLCLVSLALGLSGLAGCMNSINLGGVAVSIVDVKPAAGAPDNQAELTLRFANENVMAFGLASSTHRLFLNGIYVGKVVNSTPVGLPAMAAATQAATVQFENLALVRQLANSAGAKATSYRLESQMLALSDDEKIHVKANDQGTVDLSPLAGVK